MHAVYLRIKYQANVYHKDVYVPDVEIFLSKEGLCYKVSIYFHPLPQHSQSPGTYLNHHQYQ